MITNHRNAIADMISDRLGDHGRIEDVRVEGDRVTFLYDGLAVAVVVASAVPIAPSDAVFATGCPFCGSTMKPLVESKSDLGKTRFVPRRGCIDCGRWWDPVRIASKETP